MVQRFIFQVTILFIKKKTEKLYGTEFLFLCVFRQDDIPGSEVLCSGLPNGGREEKRGVCRRDRTEGTVGSTVSRG